MTLSIIIPTLNDANNIARLIDSIKYSTHYDATNIEIIVIDSPKSYDGTLSIAKERGAITSVIGPERSSQCNHGATIAKGVYLYFVDANMEFSKDLFSEILSNLNPNHILVIPEEVPIKSIYTKAINLEKRIYDNNNMLCVSRIMSKYSFFTVSGYNPAKINSENCDLHSKLVDSGKIVVHLNNHILHHEENLGFWKSIKTNSYYAKKLVKYSVGFQSEVNTLYRYKVLFSKPKLILNSPIAFGYLLTLKTFQFGIGYVVYKYYRNS
jgi:glycosyltransferase involved in cell wall biosynthesis